MGKLLGAFIYIQSRLKEPSSHAAVSAILTNFGLSLDTGALHDGMITAGIVFGALGFFVKEAPPLSKV